ncbi:hypothetical protein GQ457_02G020010 [Hibiscus cannabinus]
MDYAMVLTDGSWTIFGSYLTVQPWSRSFSTSEKHLSHVIVWVRLPGLPYCYYCKALFQRIAQVIGDVVKIDYNTQAGERGKFARLAILVDLNKPLRPCIEIDNFVQRLEYEGLQHICFAYGVYGHSREECGVEKGLSTVGVRPVEEQMVHGQQKSGSKELYRPWMIATNRRRRPFTGSGSGRVATETPGVVSGSRFSVLQEDSSLDVMEAVTEEANPTHVDPKVQDVESAGTSKGPKKLLPTRFLVPMEFIKRFLFGKGVIWGRVVFIQNFLLSTSNHIQGDVDAIRSSSDQGNAMEEDGRVGDSPHASRPSYFRTEAGVLDGNRQGGSGVPSLQ